MTKQLKLSAVFREAADNWLWDGDSARPNECQYSCNAVEDAQRYIFWPKARTELRAFGVPVSSLYEFREFPEGPIRQGARFLMLDFLALVLEDEENG